MFIHTNLANQCSYIPISLINVHVFDANDKPGRLRGSYKIHLNRKPTTCHPSKQIEGFHQPHAIPSKQIEGFHQPHAIPASRYRGFTNHMPYQQADRRVSPTTCHPSMLIEGFHQPHAIPACR
ncbi:hypothetical protein BgiBS90_032005 [Biomphalaria glabrata]|nr:hypothetical protein BgiBS90_032005 [Biomphalaria glabrata]